MALYGAPELPLAVPIHVVQIANSIEDEYISARYTDYVSKQRWLIESGCLADDVLGPHNIDPAQLLNNRVIPLGAPKLGEWAVGLARDMDHLSVEEKLATSLLTAPLARVFLLHQFLTHDAERTSGKSLQHSKIIMTSQLA